MIASRNSRSGVTLIEILIAVTLLSFLSVGVLLAMRVGFNTMGKIDGRLASDRRVSYASRIIENEIEGFTPVMAELPQQGGVYRFPFGQWEPQSMRFVTGFSLQQGWRGNPQISTLQVIPGADGRGVRLIVNETPYTGPRSAGILAVGIDSDLTVHYAPVSPGAGSFVLADRMASCTFSYLTIQPGTLLRQWQPAGIDPRQYPLGVRIDMSPLDTAGGDLHVSSLTLPIPVLRKPGVKYDESDQQQ